MSNLRERLRPEPPTTSVLLAWRRYLEETQSATLESYDLVEQLAWRRLARVLQELERPPGPADDP